MGSVYFVITVYAWGDVRELEAHPSCASPPTHMQSQTSTDYVISGAGSKVRVIQQERVLPNSQFAAGVQVHKGG